MEGIIKHNTSDLVLKVKDSYNPAILDLDKWERFLDILCREREYQKKAIRTAIIYMASGLYSSIEQLAMENFHKSSDLQEIYKTENEFISKLPLPQMLSGVIDLATGTGKSYVMYGIAQIMLSLGYVDKVLVLCPSLTIESGLTEKFLELSADVRLKAVIPNECIFKNPRIINANSTIKNGDICIENIHSVYETTGSSINSSLKGCGDRVLILNDEVHHVYNSSGESNIRKWKSFLTNKEYNFKYIIGLTGTAYIEDTYLNDVIFRYSLRTAIDQCIVKMVNYVKEDESIGDNEKFQKIYDNHIEFKNKYFPIKPLTILVTKDIRSANQLLEKLEEFLIKKESETRENIEKKVLIVTSSSKHKRNVIALKTVDSNDNPCEWIVSVSMLTEGWDVKNVFQIVPWEDRAFDSKLLIAQVLGRGLRIPINCPTRQPEVRVFNHVSWSKKIRLLVDEILENEMRLVSEVLNTGDRSKYNFNLYTVDYTKEERVVKKEENKTRETFDLSSGIKLISDIEHENKTTEYEDINGNISSKVTDVHKETVLVDEVVSKIVDSFKMRAFEAKIRFPKGDYQKENLPPAKEIRDLIVSSMRAHGIQGDVLTLKNANTIYSRFNGLLRSKPVSPSFQKVIDDIKFIKTIEMNDERARYGTLKRDMTIFYSDAFEEELLAEQIEFMTLLKEELPGRQVKVINRFQFKTPLNIVFTNMEPERKFVEHITSKELSLKIDSWIKSRDTGFYSIDYQKNKGGKIRNFNPDFFIKIGENIIVVEIKSDDDISEENVEKYRAAKRHFKTLNKELELRNIKQRYWFFFLSPTDYSSFVEYVKDGRIFTTDYRSELEAKLDKNEYE